MKASLKQTAPACSHALSLDEAAREDARRRLLSVRGHVEGILRMLENDSVYCVDVLKQIKAVEGALDKVGELKVEGMTCQHCVKTVRETLSAVPGVDRVAEVDLERGEALVDGQAKATRSTPGTADSVSRTVYVTNC